MNPTSVSLNAGKAAGVSYLHEDTLTESLSSMQLPSAELSASANAVKTRMRKAQKEIERPKCPSILILLYNYIPIRNVCLYDAVCL